MRIAVRNIGKRKDVWLVCVSSLYECTETKIFLGEDEPGNWEDMPVLLLCVYMILASVCWPNSTT